MNIMPFIKILRPNVVLLGVLFGLIGNLISGGINILSLITIALLIGAGNTINDYFDYEIDKINRPDRVLPKGEISRKSAFYYFIILTIIGVIISYFVNFYFFIGSILSFILFYLYAKYFKRTPFLGNVIVALISVGTLFFGILANKYVLTPFVMDLFFVCFFGSLAREIIKDIEDIEGDKKEDAITLPILIGKKLSKFISIIFVLIASYFSLKINIFLFILSVLSIPIILFFDPGISQRYLKFLMFFTVGVILYISLFK